VAIEEKGNFDLHLQILLIYPEHILSSPQPASSFLDIDFYV
jgi:hypothetical protein